MFLLWNTLAAFLVSGPALCEGLPSYWNLELSNYWRRNNRQEVIKNTVEQDGAAWKAKDDRYEWTKRIIKKTDAGNKVQTK